MTIEQINNAPKYAGIYCLKNTINGKYYIGKAVKIRQQLRQHWNNETNSKLYDAVKEHGWEAFELSILISFHDALSNDTRRKLDLYEKKYIQEFDSLNNGYNDTCSNHSKDILSKIEEYSNLKRDNSWYKAKNLETNEIFEAPTASDLSRLTGICDYCIKRCADSKQTIANRKWICAHYNDEFVDIPKYDSYEFDDLLKQQLNLLSNKESILEYIKANPNCTYGEIKQNYDLSKKTFYNYKSEVNM